MKITVINMYRSFHDEKTKSHHGKESGMKNNVIIKIMENRGLGRPKSKTTPA